MKKYTTYCVLSLLIFSLFGCTRPKPKVDMIEKQSEAVEKPIDYIETKIESSSSIHWEPWETDPIKVEKEILLDYQEKYEGRFSYYFMGSYPKIVGLQDKELETKINQWIQEAITPDTESLKGSYFSSIKEISDLEKENGKLDDMKLGSMHFNYYVSYKILLLNPKMISIMLESYYSFAGVHGYNQAKMINVDLIQKKKLTEKDLFLSNINYWKTLKPIVSKLIIDQEIEQEPNGRVYSGIFDNYDFKDIYQYFHFGLSSKNLIITFDDQENISFNRMFIVKIPYQDLKNISTYSGFDNSYSCFTYPENWTGYSQSKEIQAEQGKGISIKYPDIKDQNGKISNFKKLSNGIKIEIPFEGDKAVLQIEWKELEGKYNIPPQNIQLVPTEKEKAEQNWERIDGVWLRKNEQEKGIIRYQGIFLNTDYQITIHLPASFSDQNKREILSRINQVFGTLRFG